MRLSRKEIVNQIKQILEDHGFYSITTEKYYDNGEYQFYRIHLADPFPFQFFVSVKRIVENRKIWYKYVTSIGLDKISRHNKKYVRTIPLYTDPKFLISIELRDLDKIRKHTNWYYFKYRIKNIF